MTPVCIEQIAVCKEEKQETTLRQGRLSTPAVVRGDNVWEVRGWAQVTWAVEEVRLVLVCVMALVWVILVVVELAARRQLPCSSAFCSCFLNTSPRLWVNANSKEQKQKMTLQQGSLSTPAMMSRYGPVLPFKGKAACTYTAPQA
jgi:hypothetical protein